MKENLESEVKWYWSPGKFWKDMMHLPRGEDGEKSSRKLNPDEKFKLFANTLYQSIYPAALVVGTYAAIDYLVR